MIQQDFLSLLFCGITVRSQRLELLHILLLMSVRDKRIEFVYALISFAGIAFTLKTVRYISMLKTALCYGTGLVSLPSATAGAVVVQVHRA